MKRNEFFGTSVKYKVILELAQKNFVQYIYADGLSEGYEFDEADLIDFAKSIVEECLNVYIAEVEKYDGVTSELGLKTAYVEALNEHFGGTYE